MPFRGDLEAAHAKIIELERTVAELGRTIAERDREIQERQEALLAASPKERHAIRVRQLEAAVAQARQEALVARNALATGARDSLGSARPTEVQRGALAWGAAIGVMLTLFAVVVVRCADQ